MLSTGELLRTLEGHRDQVTAVALLADGRRALSASRELKLWDLDTGELLATFTADAELTTIDVTQDHRFVLAGSDGRLHIFRLVEREPTRPPFGVASHSPSRLPRSK